VIGVKLQIRAFIEKYILPIGLFVLLTGMYLFPSRNAYKTVSYMLFFLPVLFLCFMDGLSRVKRFYSGSALIFVLAVLYISLTSLWGEEGTFGSNFKRALLICLSGYGVFHVIKSEYFSRFVFLSIFLVSIVSAFWLVDYYFLLEQSLTSRFLGPVSSHFGLYQAGYYGGFYNPLLFGHVQGFFCTLIVVSFFSGEKGGFSFNWVLIVLSIPIVALLILAQARTSLLTFFFVFFVGLFFSKWKAEEKLKVLVVVVVLCVLVVVFFQDALSSRGLSYRPYIWSQSWNYINEAVLFGAGLGDDLLIRMPGRPDVVWSEPHNLYLSIWYYSGLVGICGVILVPLLALNEVKAKGPIPVSFLCVLTYFIMENMTDGGGVLARPNEHWFSVYLPLAYLISLAKISRTSTATIS